MPNGTAQKTTPTGQRLCSVCEASQPLRIAFASPAMVTKASAWMGKGWRRGPELIGLMAATGL